MVLASRGQRENDDGSRVPLEDDGLAAKLRTRAGRVWVMVISATVVGGVLLLAAPHPLLGAAQ